MSAPTAPIDSDLPPEGRDVLYVLELGSVWKTENLTTSGSGTATWSEVYTDTTFNSVNGTTSVQFSRIRVTYEGYIYVLCGAVKDGTAQPWMLRSRNNGLTWDAHLIESTALEMHPYTVDHQYTEYTDSNGASHNLTMPLQVYTRRGDATSTHNPWAMAFRGGGPSTSGGWFELRGDAYGGATTIHQFSATTFHPSDGLETTPIYGRINSLLGDPGYIGGQNFLDDYFGSGNWEIPGWYPNLDMPKDDARVNVRMGFDHMQVGTFTMWIESWIFWNIPSMVVPKALDYAATNSNWVYVGLKDKIMASEDGGVTWFTFYASYGAYDVRVDPQLPGAVYHWSTTGFLNLLVKDTSGHTGTLQNAGLISESPALDLPLRIARDTNSGKLWASPNGTKIVMRDGGNTADQQTGLSNCTGLHAYTGGYLIAVDSTKVWVSNDYGATWVDKTGTWSTYGSGNNAHRIKS